ncbi:MAG: hypothetical protein FJX11_20075 [Alphaproteobacteria bacterium]|nr:hypothetical protein [Alphaproteobacteria bacterium]
MAPRLGLSIATALLAAACVTGAPTLVYIPPMKDVANEPVIWSEQYAEKFDDFTKCLMTRAHMDSSGLSIQPGDLNRKENTVRMIVSVRNVMMGAYSIRELAPGKIEVAWRQHGKLSGDDNFETWAKQNADHCGRNTVRR